MASAVYVHAGVSPVCLRWLACVVWYSYVCVCVCVCVCLLR